jgi:hypothetical protein
MAATIYRTLTGQSQRSNKSHHSDISGSAHPVLTRTTTTDPLSGSLNHLTEAQLDKLDDFKALLQRDGWWTPDGLNGKPSHDDGTLLFVPPSYSPTSLSTDAFKDVISVPASSMFKAPMANSPTPKNG